MTDSRRTGIIHLHSDYSHDGRDSLGSLRKHALDRGIGFMCMTDHAEDLNESLFQDYLTHCAAVSDGQVRVFPGLEYRFDGYPGLHLLALGLTRWINPDTPEAFLDQAAGAAGFTIMAHPVYPGYRAPEPVLDRIDAIEIWNASYNTRYLPDPKAMRMVHRMCDKRPDLLGIAGLDQHDARNDREVRVLIDPGIEDDPLQALRSGRFVNAGKTMRLSPAGWSVLQLGGLSVARLLFDAVERIQHHIGGKLRTSDRDTN